MAFDPGGVVQIGNAKRRSRRDRKAARTIDVDRRGDALRRDLRRQPVEQRLTVLHDPRIEIDEVPDARRLRVGDAGDHRSAIAVADENDIVEILEPQHVRDVPAVQVDVDIGRQQMRPLA